MTAASEKGCQIPRAARRPGAFVIPNPWDAGSACIPPPWVGFEALATTSAGFAFSVGRRDAEGEGTRDEILENTRAIVDATDLPVSARISERFQAARDAARKGRTARRGGKLVGGSIELRPMLVSDLRYPGLQAGGAAVGVAQSLAFPFVLPARAGTPCSVAPTSTIRFADSGVRAAGADMLYAPACEP
jgi:2-methylisocitrate lyase-like PEP mutase family enzyme